MKDRAYAKVNFALDVFNVRQDGYHDIKSIMVPIFFYDELEINIADEDKFICNKSYVTENPNNSINKMIELFKEKYNINDHYEIVLNKCIPTKAGLGGGTSDAGSTLRILKKLYHIDLTKEEEKELCVSVGADVLFNYYNKPAVVSGIGDVVEPFNIAKQYHILLVKPYLGVSTKEAYEKLDMNVCDHPNVDRLKQALENGDSIDGLLGNSLEQPSLILNKEVNTIKELLINSGASNVLMSGSGSTVFAVSEDYDEISRLNDVVKNKKYFTRFTKTI